jgi:hypothetical protein
MPYSRSLTEQEWEVLKPLLPQILELLGNKIDIWTGFANAPEIYAASK